MGSDNAGDGSGDNRQGRRLALIIAGTAAAYVGVQILGGSFGWSMRTMGLFDLAALAVFGWALLSAFLIWRRRRDDS